MNRRRYAMLRGQRGRDLAAYNEKDAGLTAETAEALERTFERLDLEREHGTKHEPGTHERCPKCKPGVANTDPKKEGA